MPERPAGRTSGADGEVLDELVVVTVTESVVLAGAPSAPAPPGAQRDGRGLATSTAAASVVQRQRPPGSCHARGSGVFSLADPRCTPGALDPAVNQRDIATTICRYGYTVTVRPPEWVTEPEKRASMAAYGDTGRLRAFEYDHLVPLALAGSANDPGTCGPSPARARTPRTRSSAGSPS
jgi:hypothetical protein